MNPPQYFMVLSRFFLICPFIHLVVVGHAISNDEAQDCFLLDQIVAPRLKLQPMAQTAPIGGSAFFTVDATGSFPLSYQWHKGGIALPGATNSLLVLTNLQTTDEGEYCVVVSNAYGEVKSAEVKLFINMARLDTSFQTPETDGCILCLAVQADGKILVGGTFTTLGGQIRKNLGRLNRDGSLDTGFNPELIDRYPVVNALALQADGKILVGESSTSLPGLNPNSISRLHQDGSLDTSFNAEMDGSVYTMAVQADGKILVGGLFTRLGGQGRNAIGRLHPDGTVDTSFNPQVGTSYPFPSVSCLALQADGMILVGGGFETLNGQSRMCLGRLNSDGTLDANFNSGANGGVYSLVVQPDGKVLVGGNFTMLGGQRLNCIGRINSNGTMDNSFKPQMSGDTPMINFLVLQADGKILVGGQYNRLGGQNMSSVGRLQADGSVDMSFNPGGEGIPLNRVSALAVQADGKILVAGQIDTIVRPFHLNLGRLINTSPATESMSFDGSTITWWRGNASPEVAWTSFEGSSSGTDWVHLGAGTRIAGGWQLGRFSLPTNVMIRARGYTMDGRGSGWFVESNLGPPEIIEQPLSRTNLAGSLAMFGVRISVVDPLSYQWYWNGTSLSDSDSISDTRTATLTLRNVSKENEGSFTVVISNSWGSATSAVASLTVLDPWITLQPANQSQTLGESATLSVTAVGTAPLRFQWQKEGVALPGATNSLLVLTNLQATDGGEYSVIISNAYGEVKSAEVKLFINMATLDTSFQTPVTDGGVSCLAVQADGKILVGGTFDRLGGQIRKNLGRLNRDGSLDTGFNPELIDRYPWVSALAVQADGKILVGKDNMSNPGQSLNRISRLHQDGSLDTLFNAEMDGSVYTMALQADGKILVGGLFTRLSGQSRNAIGRLHPDGTVDTSFNQQVGTSALFPSVSCLALQADGKILVGGSFETLNGQNRMNIGRLNFDGTLDTLFNPGAKGEVYLLTVQADAKILVGGSFETLDGQSYLRIGRLNPDGTLDVAFNPGPMAINSLATQADAKILAESKFDTIGVQRRSAIGRLNKGVTLDSNFNAVASHAITLMTLQADGKILVGGKFTTLDGKIGSYIGRLNPDGVPDPSINLGADGHVDCLTVQADGKILVGGKFTTLGGQRCSNLVRLNNTSPATQSINFDGSTITWLRGGTSPEVGWTSFEGSANGTDWTSLGTGTRITGGWQLEGLSLPLNTIIRARGYTSDSSSSEWFLESIAGPPAINQHPLSRTNLAGSTAMLSVGVFSSEPLSYQWHLNGINLNDNDRIFDTKTATLTLIKVEKGNEGGYSVVISNAWGSVTSAVAWLTVLDPAITLQPLSQSRNWGETATLSVNTVGAEPLTYQWRKEGVAMTGATNALLILTHLQEADAGNYTVVVSNALGTVISTTAELIVHLATVDTSFNPGANNSVNLLALQSNEMILVGGDFTLLAGQFRGSIGRLYYYGDYDFGFKPEAVAMVSTLAVQTDGKILVGGSFTNLAGQDRDRIGRLNPDGTLDSHFDPGANDSVATLTVQPDGKILAGGEFTMLGRQSRRLIGRFNDDGTLDNSFNPDVNGRVVNSISVQSDGKILVCGQFTLLGGQSRTNLGRLNDDGTLDTSFNPVVEDGWIYPPAVQADGKILVGALINTPDGQSRHRIVRFHDDGTRDTRFNPETDGAIKAMVVQADGQILVSGEFTTLGGKSQNYFGRLNPDGTLDRLFNPRVNNSVNCMALQAYGNIILGGSFTTLNGLSRMNLGRLNSTGPVTNSLRFDDSTLTWLRGGAVPEVGWTIFECSTNGMDWTRLGRGKRITGGWQLAGLSMPLTTSFRARGYTSDGNSSGWFEERVLYPPVRPLSLEVAGPPNNGVLTFYLYGLYNVECEVWISKDLNQWELLAAMRNITGAAVFTDRIVPGSSRYYKLRLPSFIPP